VSWRIGIAAVVPVAVLCAACESPRFRTTVEAGFWYEDFPFTVDPSMTRALGGPLTSAEMASIKQISRAELQEAFSGLNVAPSENHDAFWRVRVRQSLERRRKQLLPNAGETLALGPLGGRSEVNFLELRVLLSQQTVAVLRSAALGQRPSRPRGEARKRRGMTQAPA